MDLEYIPGTDGPEPTPPEWRPVNPLAPPTWYDDWMDAMLDAEESDYHG